MGDLLRRQAMHKHRNKRRDGDGAGWWMICCVDKQTHTSVPFASKSTSNTQVPPHARHHYSNMRHRVSARPPSLPRRKTPQGIPRRKRLQGCGGPSACSQASPACPPRPAQYHPSAWRAPGPRAVPSPPSACNLLHERGVPGEYRSGACISRRGKSQLPKLPSLPSPLGRDSPCSELSLGGEYPTSSIP